MPPTDLTHDDATRMDIDDRHNHGEVMHGYIEDGYDGPTVTIEMPVRMALDINRTASFLLSEWTDDQCKDDAYMRHSACIIEYKMLRAISEVDNDIDAMIEYSNVLEAAREDLYGDDGGAADE